MSLKDDVMFISLDGNGPSARFIELCDAHADYIEREYGEVKSTNFGAVINGDDQIYSKLYNEGVGVETTRLADGSFSHTEYDL